MRKHTPLYEKKIYTPLYNSCNINEQEKQEEQEEYKKHSNIVVDNSYFVDSFW